MSFAMTAVGQGVDYLPDAIGAGGMKEVYLTADKKAVVCLYKDVTLANDPARLARLEKIIKANPTVTRANGGAAGSEAEAHYYRQLYCWPSAIITKPSLGVICPVYPGNFFFTSGPDWIKGKEKNGMRFISGRNRALLKRFAPQELGNFRSSLALCLNMARSVARLHNAGLAHSDLSPNNVLVDPTTGRSVMIDLDALVVEGIFPPDVLGTKGYIAPEILCTSSLRRHDKGRAVPSIRTDLHSLAVLIYQYLLLRHPLEGRRVPQVASAEEQEFMVYGPQALYCEDAQDQSNRPETSYLPSSILGAPLWGMFNRTFTTGLKNPNSRPTANEWIDALERTVDMVIPCHNHAYSHGAFVMTGPRCERCPFCAARIKGTIPVLHLQRERSPGNYTTDSQLALYQGATLKSWHVSADTLPGIGSDDKARASVERNGEDWILINTGLDAMKSAAGNLVPRKSAVLLKHGTRIQLASGHSGRSALVEIIKP